MEKISAFPSLLLSTVCVLVLMTCVVRAQQTSQTFGSGANQFTMEFTEVGNPNNMADALTGFGSVPYSYAISTYEVSVRQINAAASNGLAGVTAGSGDWNSTADGPAFGLSWYQAAAFVNWLNTSKGCPLAYNLTYNGVNYSMALWSEQQPGYNTTNPFRNSLATYFLPNEDEWYKAAYYDPQKNNNLGGYWLYPTRSDEAPTQVSAGTSPGTAVYGQTPTGSLSGASSIYEAGGASAYGTVGQGGNVFEMLENNYISTNSDPAGVRAERGGALFSPDSLLQSLNREMIGPDNSDGYATAGFRVATVPEPSTYALLLLSGVASLWALKRRKS